MQSSASVWAQQAEMVQTIQWNTEPRWKCPQAVSIHKENTAVLAELERGTQGDKQWQTESGVFTRRPALEGGRWPTLWFNLSFHFCMSHFVIVIPGCFQTELCAKLDNGQWLICLTFHKFDIFLTEKEGRWRWSGPAGVCWIFSLIRLRQISKSPKIFQ